MTGKNLDFAMRVTADLDQAVQEVDGLANALDTVKAKGQSAATGLNSASAAASKNSTAAQGNASAAKAAAMSQTALGAATQKTAAIQQKGAISSAQHAMAMHQLPMQITDIVTGLASGQSVFMVAIQQGGQLKDSFGGVVPAARALVGAINPMLVAVTAGAAAFGAIGVAMYQGYQEAREYEQAVISTGYASGVTAGQIAGMADQVGAATGKFGDADDAMLILAGTGKLTGDTLKTAAEAAVNLATLTGESIESTTEKIISLADAPSATLAKLNQQYHFLTAEVYEHVRSLEEQGRAEDAARAAVEAFATVHEQRVREAEERAGYLERAWKGLGETISAIWNGMKDIGRTDAEYRLQAAKEALGEAQARASARGFPFDPSRYNATIAALEKQVAAEQKAAAQRAAAQAAEDKKIKASDERRKKDKQALEDAERGWEQRAIGDLGKKEKLDEKILQIRREGALLKKSEAEIEAQVANARARYAESLPKGRKPQAGKSDAQQAEESAQRELENLKKQVELTGNLADGEKRVSEEARVAYEIKAGAYRLASASVQHELLAQAKRLDAIRIEREEAEKLNREKEEAQRNYERLRQSLETPIEAALSDVQAQVKTLNEAMAMGIPIAGGYQDALRRIFDQQLKPLDDFSGALYQYGIGDPEQDRMADMLKELQSGYELRRAIINQALQQENADREYWHERSEQLERQHQQALTNLAIVDNQLRLAQIGSTFNSMAQIAAAFAGEQSRTYQVLFALSKGFAVAQAAVSLATNVAKASEKGFPENLPFIAAAFHQGAQIAQIIAGANYAPGYAGGGYTGPGGRYEPAGIVHRGEGVLNQDDMRALGGPAGFYALRNAIHRGYAAGGVVDAPITIASEGRYRPAAAPSASTLNQMSLYLFQDRDALAQALANHPANRKAILAEVGENGQAIRTSWES